ncbi:TetR/AcrR family transcriptional regulator [Streptomyces spinoverrucosus]|uniref:TetR/AcrR family transcriptional regulator n=1 Tax=Streptomyces spinoverrucosus TaxID=284043 RepID=UPI001E5203B9|nr:TetR/AcrR family transcriptional regulator [Streptomyces spinoverrucosus]
MLDILLGMSTQRARGEAATGRPLRRDAQRNRDALLSAARACLAEQGMEASLEQVAKRAGLAIGTLYRHFPTRLHLVQAVFADKIEAWREAAEKAAAMDDAWEGLCLFLETMCELQVGDRGFQDLAAIRLPETACLAGAQSRIYELAVRIVERAQEQGTLRSDITSEDLTFVIWANGSVTEATEDVAPGTWRRFLHLLLDGFRAERAHPLPQPPLSKDELYRAMLRLDGDRDCTG